MMPMEVWKQTEEDGAGWGGGGAHGAGNSVQRLSMGREDRTPGKESWYGTGNVQDMPRLVPKRLLLRSPCS